jgi:hypothetical protein
MTHLERELRKMTKAELVAYHNVLVATTRMVDTNPERTAEHLSVVKKILGVGGEMKRLEIKGESREG